MADEIQVIDLRTGVERTVTRKAYMALGPNVYKKVDSTQEQQPPASEDVQDSVDEPKIQTEPAAMEETPAPVKKRGRKPKAISSDDAEEK